MMKKFWVIVLTVFLCLGGLTVSAQETLLLSIAPCWYGETYSVDCTYTVSGGEIDAVSNLLTGDYFFDWNYIAEEGLLLVAVASASPFPAPEQVEAFVSVAAAPGTTLTLKSLRINGKKAEIGHSVSGTVTSFGKETDKISVCLIQDGTEKYAVSIVGNTASYNITNVSSGKYILQVSKANHVTGEYTVVVNGEDVVQDMTIWLFGDVNQNGCVSEADNLLMKQYFSGAPVLFNETLADINGDGSVTRADAMILARHLAKWPKYAALPYRN